MAARPLLVLYGTQTGCAQEVAERIGREAKRRHFQTRVIGLGEYDKTRLPTETLVIFVVSTTGQGEVPDNMKVFWRFLLQKSLPNNSLCNTRFAVFGLAKMLFKRLQGLGAKEIVRRGDGDDQHDLGLDYELEIWEKELFSSLLSLYPLPPGLEILPKKQKPPPRYHLVLHDPSTPLPSKPSKSTPERYSQAHMYMATLKENRRITAPDWDQDVRHIELDISSGGANKIRYQLGDVVYIQPKNEKEAALQFLKTLNFDPSTVIMRVEHTDPDTPVPNVGNSQKRKKRREEEKIKEKEMRVRDLIIHIEFPITLLELCEIYLDILGTPRRYFFELLSYFATSEPQQERLEYFASMEGQDDLRRYNHKERRTFIEALNDFPSSRFPLDYLLDFIPPLLARPFSISSSPAQSTNADDVMGGSDDVIQVTAAIVRFKTPSKRLKIGVCSSWLDKLPKGHEVPIWVKPSGSTMPGDARAPMVMVGPGTGCAMFRAFLMHRRVLHSSGVELGNAIFFFGCRHSDKDYLYKDEFENHSKIVPGDRVYVAFSRDQAQKRYVQHLIKEHGAEVWKLIGEERGYFYISGSADKMPKDVKRALVEVISKEGEMNEEEGENFVKRMEQTKRYQVETWSH